MSTPRVGVLALQGDTREHLAALREAGADATTVRRLSDQYYHGKQRWNKLYMCRQCGQLVAS